MESNTSATDTRTPAELEMRRREIVTSLTTTYAGYDDPAVPMDLLRELAFLTSTLRRRNSGPPRRKASRKTPPTIEDLLI